jgi:hypothetical protein
MEWDNYGRISLNRKTISDRVFCVSLYVPAVDYYESLRDINAYGDTEVKAQSMLCS